MPLEVLHFKCYINSRLTSLLSGTIYFALMLCICTLMNGECVVVLQDAICQEDKVIVSPPRVPLSSAHIDRHGAYLMDSGTHMYLWIGAAISDQFCLQVLDCDSYQNMPETMVLTRAVSLPLDRSRTKFWHILIYCTFYAILLRFYFSFT